MAFPAVPAIAVGQAGKEVPVSYRAVLNLWVTTHFIEVTYAPEAIKKHRYLHCGP